MNFLLHTAVNALPNPSPEQPPGTEGLLTVLNWVSWIMIILALGAFLVGAGMLAFAAWSGRDMAGYKGLVLPIIAAILVGAAGGIMRLFV